jgi:hypothetical protein
LSNVAGDGINIKLLIIFTVPHVVIFLEMIWMVRASIDIIRFIRLYAIYLSVCPNLKYTLL